MENRFIELRNFARGASYSMRQNPLRSLFNVCAHVAGTAACAYGLYYSAVEIPHNGFVSVSVAFAIACSSAWGIFAIPMHGLKSTARLGEKKESHSYAEIINRDGTVHRVKVNEIITKGARAHLRV